MLPIRYTHPLAVLDGVRLDSCRLRLVRLSPTPKSGWKEFALSLADAEGDFSPMAITGLHSVGGRGVAPWIEIIDYQPTVVRGTRHLNLAHDGLDVMLFQHLARLVPPGGHLMLWCEAAAHQATYQALTRGVPPAATPLGALLVRAGFPRVRFFDLAEGGWEGGKKLWAEQAPDPVTAARWRAQTASEVRVFIHDAQANGYQDSCLNSAMNALDSLATVEIPAPG